VYLVADNAAVNKSLATMLEIPMIGCASHRFNLACQKYLEKYEVTLSKINTLMGTLRNVKQAGKLRRKGCNLEPVMRNQTRWSSTHAMVQRFFRIQEYLDTDDPVLVDLLPTFRELRELKSALEDLTEFEKTTKTLQHEDRTMLEVRNIFDAMLGVENFKGMKHYISNAGGIVHSNHFENGLVKLQSGDSDQLTDREKRAMSPFLKVNSANYQAEEEALPAQSMSIAERALAGTKNKKRKVVSDYVDVERIPPTSNIVERLFSASRLVLTDYRKCMSPYSFECVMFLKYNREHWNIGLIHELIMHSNKAV
jgi:hypothetical protein